MAPNMELLEITERNTPTLQRKASAAPQTFENEIFVKMLYVAADRNKVVAVATNEHDEKMRIS